MRVLTEESVNKIVIQLLDYIDKEEQMDAWKIAESEIKNRGFEARKINGKEINT